MRILFRSSPMSKRPRERNSSRRSAVLLEEIERPLQNSLRRPYDSGTVHANQYVCNADNLVLTVNASAYCLQNYRGERTYAATTTAARYRPGGRFRCMVKARVSHPLHRDALAPMLGA